MTHDEGIYSTAERYGDHGHDHFGSDRGLEEHSMLGNNFRISELNAAVGLAQLRKLDSILEKQRSHKKAIKEGLAHIQEIGFPDVPDEKGDSATFLSLFLPDESRARKLAKDLEQAGLDGCFYWYDNNWHYVRKWDHLKHLRSAATLPIHLLEQHPDYEKVELPRSDSIISRTISIQIKLSWTKEELADRIEKITGAVGS